jgi:hypothetical protein
MARKKRRVVVRDRKKTAARIAATIVILLVLAGIGALIFFKAQSCSKKLSARSLPLIASEQSCGTGDGILYVRAGQLDFYSFKDEDENFSLPLSSAPKGIVGTSGIKAVYSESTIQIIDAPFDVDPEGEIAAVRCGETFVATLSRKTAGGCLLSVYNSTGQLVHSLEYPDGRLMDFGFSEASSSTLWTMELDTDSGSPRTTITTFDISRMSSTGVIIVSGQLVEDIFFTESSIFVIGTESLIRYSASANREIYRVRIYGYRVIDRSRRDGNPVLLLLPRGVSSVTEAASVRVLTVSQKDVAGETAYTFTLPEGLLSCHLQNGSLVALTANNVYLYKPKGGYEEILPMPTGVTVSSKKLDDRHILLERSGEYVLLTTGK